MAVNYHVKRFITFDNGGIIKYNCNLLGYFNPNDVATTVNYRGIFITLTTGANVIKQIPR